MRRPARIVAGAVLLASACAAASAAELRVLSAGAMRAGLIAAAPAFRESGGHTITTEFAIASELRRRVADIGDFFGGFGFFFHVFGKRAVKIF